MNFPLCEDLLLFSAERQRAFGLDSSDIPQIPRLLKTIFHPIEARRNEIRSHLSVPAAKSSDWPPRSAGTRRLAFNRAHLRARRARLSLMRARRNSREPRNALSIP